MKYLFLISHPAHYHLFKHFISELELKGHWVKLLVRPKDVLIGLMDKSGFQYQKVSSENLDNTYIGMFFSLIKRIYRTTRIAKVFKPNFLIGSDSTLAFVGKILNIPSFEFSEDDEHVIKLYARISYPFYTAIISPNVCSAGKWEYKKIGYDGYHELAFLSDKYFKPNKDIIKKYNLEEPYCLLRLSSLSAHHDKKIKGIKESVAFNVINYLKSRNIKVYITSEKRPNSNLKPYILDIDPIDMHQVLYFSEILISDSQSMTMESAILGTPSLRISSFSGEISVLEELENKYKLTYSILPDQADNKALELVRLLLNQTAEKYLLKREILLREKIDVVQFYLSFFENYPESLVQAKSSQN